MHHHGQDCLRLRVDVAGHKGSGKTHPDKSKADDTGKSMDGGKKIFAAAGGVHNPSNRLPAGEDSSKKNTRQMQDSPSSPTSERSSAGRGHHEGMMKPNTDSLPPFSFLRWPRCDGAKRSDEHRQFGSTAALPSTLLYHDPSLTSPDAAPRLIMP